MARKLNPQGFYVSLKKFLFHWRFAWIWKQNCPDGRNGLNFEENHEEKNLCGKSNLDFQFILLSKFLNNSNAPTNENQKCGICQHFIIPRQRSDTTEISGQINCYLAWSEFRWKFLDPKSEVLESGFLPTLFRGGALFWGRAGTSGTK